MFQYRFHLTQVKRNLISSITNLVHKLPHELPNDLRRRVLRTQNLRHNSKILVKTQHSAQSHSQKLDFSNSSQNVPKSKYQSSLLLSDFTGLLYFVRNILSEIVVLSTNILLTLLVTLSRIVAFWRGAEIVFFWQLFQNKCNQLFMTCKHSFILY